MPGAAFLHGDRLTLRTVEPDDHGFLHRHWNDPAVRRGFARHVPRTRDDIADELDADDAVHLLACRDRDPVGFVWLFNVDDAMGRAELGYWIAPDEQSQDYATETAALAARHAFDDRGLHRLTARVLDWNDASRRVLENAGFRQEGTLRDHYFVDGYWVDAHLYGLLAGER